MASYSAHRQSRSPSTRFGVASSGMATTPKKPVPKSTKVGTFTPIEGDTAMRWTRPEHRYRFLLADGSTVDVVTEHRDGSELRADVVSWTGTEQIMGMADITPQ
jgi:hypothetical protein